MTEQSLFNLNESLPDFLVVGASRSGTTTLWDCLRQHPDIFMPSTKELHFFSREDNFKKGVKYYQTFFAGAPKGKLKGEVSPTYFHNGKVSDLGPDRNLIFNEHDDAPIRVKRLLPNAKIVITLRNPVDRICSQYARLILKSKETSDSLRLAIVDELEGRRDYKTNKGSYLYNSNYLIHIEKWLSLYPKSQLHIMIFEEWLKNPAVEFKKLFEFLEVTKNFQIPSLKHLNKGKATRFGQLPIKFASKLPTQFNALGLKLFIQSVEPISQVDRDFIFKLTSTSISEMEKILGRELSVWKS